MTIIRCIECIDMNEIRCSWSAIYAYPIQATLATLDSIVKKNRWRQLGTSLYYFSWNISLIVTVSRRTRKCLKNEVSITAVFLRTRKRGQFR